jgi:hypothetical protein
MTPSYHAPRLRSSIVHTLSNLTPGGQLAATAGRRIARAYHAHGGTR